MAPLAALALYERKEMSADALKPSPNEVMKKHGIADKDGVDFIRAYEAEIVRTIEGALVEAIRR